MTRRARVGGLVAGAGNPDIIESMLEQIRVARDYLREEGRVIRKAPAAFFVGWAMTGVIVFGLADWHFTGEIDTMQKTIENQNSTIENEKAHLQYLNDKFTEVRRQLDKITATSAINSSTGTIMTLGTLSNSALKADAEKFVNGLREFDAKFVADDEKKDSEEFAKFSLIPRKDTNRLERMWAQRIVDDQDRRNRHNEEFQTRYRPVALAYRDEICKREEIVSPCPHDQKSVPLDIGTVMGIYPITQLTDYLDKIIRSLPDN